jgi:membrane protein
LYTKVSRVFAYDVEDRPVWKTFPLSVRYTLVLTTLLIVAAGLMFMGPKLIEPILQPLGVGQVFVTVWSWARIPVAVLLLMLAVALIYWLFPNVKKPVRFITPGAVLAVIVWIVASLGFSFYVANFSSYSATYGASVVVLLLYFFISAAILLLGAEINAENYRAMAEEGDDGQADSA